MRTPRKTNKPLLFVVAFLVLSTAGAFYFHVYSVSKVAPIAYKTPEESDKYVRFDMEVYDQIQTTYWMKSTDSDLAGLFQLSIDKVLSTTTSLLTKDRAGTAKMLAQALQTATSTENRKQIALNTVIVALYNLQPTGRDQIFSQKQETAFRENVSNIKPANDLYGDLGLVTGATLEQVKKASEDEITKLENATSTEDKAKLEKVKYASTVLTNTDNKALYDQAKIEPTLKSKKFGSTLYVDLSQIAPTSLYELVKTIDNASTTANYSSLVIDLRGNIGGSLDFLPAFFGLFVGKDQWAFDFFQQGNYLPERTTQPKYPEFARFKEIAILTDNMTQSTAELTAATFKRFHMAKIVGTTTRGWGTIENTYPIKTELDSSEKYALLLVNSITLRDDGQPIEGRGVDPDVNISDKNWKSQLSLQFKSQSIISAIEAVLK